MCRSRAATVYFASDGVGGDTTRIASKTSGGIRTVARECLNARQKSLRHAFRAKARPLRAVSRRARWSRWLSVVSPLLMSVSQVPQLRDRPAFIFKARRGACDVFKKDYRAPALISDRRGDRLALVRSAARRSRAISESVEIEVPSRGRLDTPRRRVTAVFSPIDLRTAPRLIFSALRETRARRDASHHRA